jgi:hypothetical protein
MPPSNDYPQPGPRAGRQASGPRAPAAPAVQQRAAAALGVALLSLVGVAALGDLTRGIYMVLYALLADVTALWLSVTAIIRARRDSTARPRGSVTATVIAGVGIVLSTVLLSAFMVLGKQLSGYGQCLAGANTISSQRTCQSQFSHAISREMTALRTVSG